MIKIYPVKIEAYDDVLREPMFKLETFDSEAATLEMKT